VADAIVDDCRRLDLGCYFGVLPRPVDQVGTDESITLGRAVWADIDDKDTGGRRESWRLASSVEPAPSAIVVSGGGLHLYYFLDKPAAAKDIRHANALLWPMCGGDRSVVNVGRIMRLPGSWHCKGVAERVKFARNSSAPLGQDFYPDRKYSLDRLVQTWSEHPQNKGDGGQVLDFSTAKRNSASWMDEEPQKTGLSPKISALIEENATVRDRWEGRGAAQTINGRPGTKGSGSEYDYQFARECLYQGANVEETAAAVNVRLKMRGKKKSFGYAMTTTTRALEKLGDRRAKAANSLLWPMCGGDRSPLESRGELSIENAGNPLELVVYSEEHRDKSKRGKPLAILPNCVRILERCPLMAGRLKYNQFKGQAELDGERMADADITQIRLDIYRAHGCNYGKDMAAEGIEYVSAANPYHPVRDWLESVAAEHPANEDLANSWLFSSGVDIPEDKERAALISEIGRKWLVSAVNRILNPGCKVDSTLILLGPQGAGKSTLFREMAHDPSWFSDSAIDVRGGRDTYSRLKGVWLYEFAELAATRTRESESIKAFLTSQIDIYRPAYARYDIEVPRQCVFVGTSNELEILRDPTGARRFWPIQLGGQLATQWIKDNHARIWAAAVHLAKAGESWHLDAKSADALVEMQAIHKSTDPWEEALMDDVGLVSGGYYTLKTILQKVAGLEPHQMNRAVSMRMAGLLSANGWTKKREYDSEDNKRKMMWFKIGDDDDERDK
jgi:putative DNA primase/helicase